MNPKPRNDQQTYQEAQNINNVFEQVSAALKYFNTVCAKNGSPLRGVSYRVLDNGCTKLHVTYRRVSKKKK